MKRNTQKQKRKGENANNAGLKVSSVEDVIDYRPKKYNFVRALHIYSRSIILFKV